MDKKYIFFIVLFLIILTVSYLIYKSQDLKRTYEAEVQTRVKNTETLEKDILTEDDIKHLPEPVQKYIRYTGVIGKEKVRNFKVTFEGEFKTDPKNDWAKMSAVQYSDVIDTTRLYFMKLKMFGLPVVGLHKYSDAKAIMLVKIAGLITAVDGKGREMDLGETVTVFNDMCMMVPGSLIDKRIEWDIIDPLTVKAAFDNNGRKISAVLYFNDKGELRNFVSEDRYYSLTGKTYERIRWSTPVSDYKDYNGIRIGSGGEAVWSLPEGDYVYGRIELKNIEYNVKE